MFTNQCCTLLNAVSGAPPFNIQQKLGLAYHKMLSNQPLSSQDQFYINRTYHRLSAGLYLTHSVHTDSAQTAAQPSSLELDFGGSFNEKMDDTHGADGVFVDALEDTLPDTQNETSADFAELDDSFDDLSDVDVLSDGWLEACEGEHDQQNLHI